MKITIEYESSWRNSFLAGSNNETLPKGGRSFIGSIKALNDKSVDNFIERTITEDTVMGILNRLIGEQRKLYQARQDEHYYFRDIERILTKADIQDDFQLDHEIVYLRNISGNTDPKSFTGMIKLNVPWLSAKYASDFWKVLWFNVDELMDFISDEKYFNASIAPLLDPLSILDRLETIKKTKATLDEKLEKVRNILEIKYPKFKLKESKGKAFVLPLYCSSLYLQLERLSKIFDTSLIKAPKGGLTGISHNGFTPKNFMGYFTTGKEKIVWGNPYIKEYFLAGEGKVNKCLTKASGLLEINLNISKERALDLNQKILDAGVSSFYLGKKGLAYVKSIRI